MNDQDVLEKYRGANGFIHLQRTYSSLYEKSLYTIDLPIVVNRIVEYDLKAANISAMRASGKFSDSMLDDLSELPKLEREVLVGKMRREDKSITKIINSGIKRAKMELFEANLIQDSEVISIKNDAVFIAGRRLKHTEFGPFRFVAKNTYGLFLRLDKQLEFYYDGKRDILDIKGIGDDILEDPDQQNGMVQFFKTVFQFLIKGRTDNLRRYLIQFVQSYKRMELPICYYKELNSFNIYRSKIELSGYQYQMSTVGEEDKQAINGIYNYTRYILPIIQAFL